MSRFKRSTQRFALLALLLLATAAIHGDGALTTTSGVFPYPAGWDFSGAWDTQVFTGDFNGDGRADFVRVGPNGMHVFFSDGQGGFEGTSYLTYVDFGLDFSDQSLWHTVVGDFDGDGRADVMEVGATRSYVFLSRVTGMPGGTLPSDAFSLSTYDYPAGWDFTTWDGAGVPVSVGDFNGDGRTDFLRFGDTYLVLFLSDGSGGFTASEYAFPTSWDFGLDQNVWQTVVGDFDGDGRTDVMEMSGTYVRMFLSKVTDVEAQNPLPSTAFSISAYQYPAGWNFAGTWSGSSVPVSLGDFNGDGRTDFVRFGPTYMYVFLSDGTGGFSPYVYNYPAGWDFGFDQSVWRTLVGDFDGDGRADVLELSATYGHVFLSRMTGTSLGNQTLPSSAFSMATWQYPSGWLLPLSTYHANTGDVDGNGRSDLLRVGETQGATTLFFYPGATVLTVGASTAAINGSATLTAELQSSSGTPLVGKTITFALNGVNAGTATTDSTGAATLPGVALGGTPAGTYAGAITASFAGDPDAASASGTGTLTVQKELQALTIAPVVPLTYGTAPFSPSITAGASGQPVVLTGAGACLASGTTVTITSAGVCTITATQAGDATYEPAAATLAVSVAPAALTITTVSTSRPYGAPNPPFTVTAAGLVNGDSLASLQGTPVFVTNATSTSPVGAYPVTPGGWLSTNYAITFVPGTLDVQPAVPTITITGGPFTYDGQPHGAVVTATGIDGAVVGPAVVTYNGSASVPINAGAYVVAASTAAAGNYAAATATATLTINKAPAQILLSGLSRTYTGQGLSAVAATNPSGVTGVSIAYAGVSQDLPVNAGTYSAVATLTNANYTAPPVTAAFVILPATPTLSVTGATVTYDGQPHGATAVARGVNGESLGPVAVTYNGSGAVPIHAGSYTVQASLAPSGNYTGAAAGGMVIILQATPVVNWPAPSPIVYGAALRSGQLDATANIAGAFVYAPPAGTILNVGTTTIAAVFAPADVVDFTTASASVPITVLNADARFVGDGRVDSGPVDRTVQFHVETTPTRVEGRLGYRRRTAVRRADEHRGDDDREGDRGDRFESDAVTTAAVVNSPGGEASTGRKNAPVVNGITFSGTGRWNGADGYTFTATALDAAGRGRPHDHFAITIRDASGAVVDTVDANLTTGRIESLPIGKFSERK